MVVFFSGGRLKRICNFKNANESIWTNEISDEKRRAKQKKHQRRAFETL